MAMYEDLFTTVRVSGQRVKHMWRLLYRTVEHHNKFLRQRLKDTPYRRTKVMLVDHDDYVREIYRLARRYSYNSNRISVNENYIWNFSIYEFRAAFALFEERGWVKNMNAGIDGATPLIGITR
jgi:hypothetical protein